MDNAIVPRKGWRGFFSNGWKTVLFLVISLFIPVPIIGFMGFEIVPGWLILDGAINALNPFSLVEMRMYIFPIIQLVIYLYLIRLLINLFINFLEPIRGNSGKRILLMVLISIIFAVLFLYFITGEGKFLLQ